MRVARLDRQCWVFIPNTSEAGMQENNDLLYKYEIMALLECDGIESVYQDLVKVHTKQEAEYKLELMIDLACAFDQRVKVISRSVTLTGARTLRKVH